MAKLVWDTTGERFFETGVDHGVLFVQKSDGTYDNGVAWNGLTSVNESPEGGEPNPYYADNIKYLNIVGRTEWSGSIEAYTYPEEFKQCDGTAEYAPGMYVNQQLQKSFAFCYRTKIGNDTDGIKKGYKIHIVYGCFATPSEKAYGTISDSVEPITFSWDLSSTPVELDDESFDPVSSIDLDSTVIDATKLATIEASLYGTNAGEGGTPAATEPTLLMPDDIADIINRV